MPANELMIMDNAHCGYMASFDTGNKMFEEYVLKANIPAFSVDELTGLLELELVKRSPLITRMFEITRGFLINAAAK